jgi:HlyD family secretion protein
LVVALIATTSGLLGHSYQNDRPDLALHTVRREPVRGTITARGTLEADQNTEVVCRVKSLSGGARPTTIRWIIDDGTPVQPGDLLVQLDDSELYEQLGAQRIALELALANWVQAEKNHDLVVAQNKSDAASANLALELATLDLEKYSKGDYPQRMQDIEGRRRLARSDLAMWEERAAWSARMARPGRRFVPAAQSRSDEAMVKSARVALAKVEEERRVLTEFTGPRTTKLLTGKVDEARRAVDRVRIQARAKEIRDDRIRRARFRVYSRTLLRYNDVEAEIKKCRILAPHGGLVVYNVSAQTRSGAGSQQAILAQGEPVREGQRLMVIPNLDGMVVHTQVHEALIARVRGEKLASTGFCESVRAGLLLDQPPFGCLGGQMAFAALRDELRDHYKALEYRTVAGGQPAEIRVEAFPDRPLAGEVRAVSTLPSRQDSWSADVNLYQALISVKEAFAGWRPGMSAAVTIFTEDDHQDCLAVPIQAIVGGAEIGDRREVHVWTEDGPVAREVVVGQSDEKLAEIVSGLTEGEQVVLNPGAP